MNPTPPSGLPVPNQFPSLPVVGPARIAIVGQSPGAEEDYYRVPFVGESGRFLDSALGHVGIARAQCFVGNVSQIRPAGNFFDAFEWEGDEVQDGIEQLEKDLEKFDPTMVLTLGNEALHLFKESNIPAPKRAGRFDWPNKIGDWRGSVFESPWLDGVKTMGTYHPAAVLREWSLQAYVRFDLAKLRREAGMRGVARMERKIGIAGVGE